jgi:ADP-ribose pyrophosphatase YjhB (NUDIX family)
MENTPKAGVDYIGISVAFFCHDGRDKFLFHKRSKTCRDEQGTWDCGGGKLEFGESIEEGLMRELQEEYGCSGNITESLPPNSYIRSKDETKRHWIILPYIVQVDSAQAKLNEPESMDEIGWFPLNKLPEPLHSGVRADIEMYSEQLRKYSP